MIPCAACGVVPYFEETFSGAHSSVVIKDRGVCRCGAWTCRARFEDGRRSFEWAWGAHRQPALVRLSQAFDEWGRYEESDFMGGLMAMRLQHGKMGALWADADPEEVAGWDLVGMLTAQQVMGS